MTIIPQQHVGAVSAGVAVGGTVLSRAIELQPLLQDLALLVSILAGLVSVAWHVYKFKSRK